MGILASAVLHRNCLGLVVAAALGVAPLVLAPSPAAAQAVCNGPGWDSVDVGAYTFAWVSRRRGSGANTQAVNCVRNLHRSRGIHVDWEGTGLRSVIPPGRTAYRASRISRAAATRSKLHYGARPTTIDVALVAASGSRLGSRLGAPSPLDMFRRASLAPPEEMATVAAEAGAVEDNASIVYLPIDLSFLTSFARRLPVGSLLIRRLEDHPALLQPFAMTFENRESVDARGRVTIAYECVYSVPSLGPRPPRLLARNLRLRLPFLMRFTDADLHARMFGRADPVPIVAAPGEDVTLRAELAPAAPEALIERTARLDILLADAVTVIASLPIAYRSPRPQ